MQKRVFVQRMKRPKCADKETAGDPDEPPVCIKYSVRLVVVLVISLVNKGIVFVLA